MLMFRRYLFELCWLLLIIVLATARVDTMFQTSAWDWEDLAFNCADTNGWCILAPSQIARLPGEAKESR